MSKSGVRGWLDDDKDRNKSAQGEKDRKDLERLKAADKANKADRKSWGGKRK